MVAVDGVEICPVLRGNGEQSVSRTLYWYLLWSLSFYWLGHRHTLVSYSLYDFYLHILLLPRTAVVSASSSLSSPPRYAPGCFLARSFSPLLPSSTGLELQNTSVRVHKTAAVVPLSPKCRKHVGIHGQHSTPNRPLLFRVTALSYVGSRMVLLVRGGVLVWCTTRVV